MLNELKPHSFRAALALLTLTLTACANLSQISDQGTTDQAVWPNAADTTFNVGAFPSVENLKLVDRGMTKDQLYNLLGRPHFAEGLVGVREWDYLFHFRTANGDVSCQYKVLFDKEKRAQTFLWNPADCADRINPKPVAVAEKSYSLNSDVLFAFGSATLTASGKAEVARVAETVAKKDTRLTVIGHTDRIGSDSANLSLSRDRAEAVRRELTTHGVSPARVVASGAGKNQPVVTCELTERAAEIACLSPNRRVEIIER